ncbi:MAG: hypothetical protein KatS3mg010_0637 [Acidimicrobiia bacterium]|nr:MAG: hypothetical protein KatS3mg010_0637 [Acidimicrobiia bacterium]
MTTTAPPPSPPAEDVPGVTRRHRFSDLYHERTNFQFIAHSRRWAILSGILLLVSLAALVTRGLNLSIEFEGGTAWVVEMAGGRDASVGDVRDLLDPLGFADSKISVLSGAGGESVRVQAEVIEDPTRKAQRELAALAGIDDADVQFTRSEAGGTFALTAAGGERADRVAGDGGAGRRRPGRPATWPSTAGRSPSRSPSCPTARCSRSPRRSPSTPGPTSRR